MEKKENSLKIDLNKKKKTEKRETGMWGRRSCLLPVWVLSVLCVNWLVGLSTAENCTDGYDDVYSLAMKHWAKNNYEVKNQVRFAM